MWVQLQQRTEYWLVCGALPVSAPLRVADIDDAEELAPLLAEQSPVLGQVLYDNVEHTAV